MAPIEEPSGAVTHAWDVAELSIGRATVPPLKRPGGAR